MGIRTDLLVTEEIAESSDLRATPFEFERAKRVEAALSILEGKWKIVILNRLFARPIWRFSELERAVPGISQRLGDHRKTGHLWSVQNRPLWMV